MSNKIESLEKKEATLVEDLAAKSEAVNEATVAETAKLNELAAVRAELGAARALAQQEKGLGTVEVARNGFPDGVPA